METDKDDQSHEHWFVFFKVKSWTPHLGLQQKINVLHIKKNLQGAHILRFLKIVSFIQLFFYVFKSIQIFTFGTLFNFSLKDAKVN